MIVRTSSGFRNSLLQHVRDDILDGAILRFYDGTMPASADEAETGDLLVEITLDGGSVVPGSPTNCLDFSDISHEESYTKTVLAKPTDETWKGTAVRNGTIRYGRLYSNNRTLGESTVAVRFDGDVSTVSGGATFVASASTTKAGVEVTVSECNLVFSYS